MIEQSILPLFSQNASLVHTICTKPAIRDAKFNDTQTGNRQTFSPTKSSPKNQTEALFALNPSRTINNNIGSYEYKLLRRKIKLTIYANKYFLIKYILKERMVSGN